MNEAVRVADGDVEIANCLGQRFIAAGMSNKKIVIDGIPGNALGAYLNGAEITVHANAQDAVGDTMNDGRIVIHGNIGDAAGDAMRGGEIFVQGNVGYRAGIHMKEYTDNAATFCTVVKTIAARNGLHADFSPKPLQENPGSGFHINISVKGGDEFVMHRTMGGILKHIADMTLFLNPSECSYQRLGANKAPKYISWSSDNRSQLIRVPAAEGEYRRFELRSPDCTANPYLAFALLIWAGLDGILNNISLPEKSSVNLYAASPKELWGLETLPLTRNAAAKISLSSEFIREHLPESLINYFRER